MRLNRLYGAQSDERAQKGNERRLIANMINQSINTFSFCEGDDDNGKMRAILAPYERLTNISMSDRLNVDAGTQCAGM